MKQATTDVQSQRKHWWRKLLWAAPVGIGLLLLVVYFVVASNTFFKGFLLPKINASLHAEVTVNDGALRPFSGLVLNELKVQPHGQEPLLTARKVSVRYRWWSLLRGELALEEITVESPIVRYLRKADGTSNLDPLWPGAAAPPPGVPPSSKPSSPAAPPRVDLRKLSITNGLVVLNLIETNGHRLTVEVTDLDLKLHDVRNGHDARLALAAGLLVNRSLGTNVSRLSATNTAQFGIRLDRNLAWQSVTGTATVAVAKATGAFAAATHLNARMVADLRPTGNQQLKLALSKAGAAAGNVAVQGPFDLEKTEGDLQVVWDQWDLPRWPVLVGPMVQAGLLGGTLDLEVREAGNQLGYRLESGLTGLALLMHSNRLDGIGARLATRGQVAQFTNVELARFDLQLTNLVMAGLLIPSNAAPLAVGLTLAASANPQQLQLREAKLALAPTERAQNQITVTGHLVATNTNAFTGTFALASDAVDLTHYYDLFVAAAAPVAPAATNPAVAAVTNGAPAAPAVEPPAVRLPLRDFTLTAHVARAYLRETTVTNFTGTTWIDGGRIVVQPLALVLNGAPASGQADMDLGQPGYAYSLDFQTRDLPLAPLINSFSPERRGQVSGTLTTLGHFAGAGLTPTNLQQHLTGTFELGTTNLHVPLARLQIPLLSPAVQGLIALPNHLSQGLGGLDQLGLSLGTDWAERVDSYGRMLTRSVVDVIQTRGRITQGRIELEQAVVQSPAFQMQGRGHVKIAPAPGESQVDFPVRFALHQAVAEKIKLAEASAPDTPTFVNLGELLSLQGSLQNPERKFNREVVLQLAKPWLTRAAGASPLVERVLDSLKQFEGGTPATPDASATNAPPKTRLLDLLPRFLK